MQINYQDLHNNIITIHLDLQVKFALVRPLLLAVLVPLIARRSEKTMKLCKHLKKSIPRCMLKNVRKESSGGECMKTDVNIYSTCAQANINVSEFL